MNANKLGFKVLACVAAGLFAGSAMAVQGVDASGNSKINNAMAKRWKDSNAKDGYNDPVDQKRVVNFGKKKSGDCVVNVGTAQPGQKATKEIVVTTKEVINVCK
jgi:hypothetical protein